MFKLLDLNGKYINKFKTYQKACAYGYVIFNKNPFRVQEKNKKSELIDKSFLNWMEDFYSSMRVIKER